MTLCGNCVSKWQHEPWRNRKNVQLDEPITDMPIGNSCEECGKKVVPCKLCRSTEHSTSEHYRKMLRTECSVCGKSDHTTEQHSNYLANIEKLAQME